mgnify:CR=1 FL=1
MSEENKMDFSFEGILNRLKSALKDEVNKLEGGFCMDNIQAVAEEMARICEMEVSSIPDHVLLDTAEGEYLDRKALDYNETRLEGETDDAFRARIFQKIQNPLTSGNKNHYIYWAKSVPNIGDAKCIPCWNGPGTVKVIVISAQKDVPGEEDLQAVREYIEENRPVGAAVTVAAASPVLINIDVVISMESGFGFEAAKTSIGQYIQEYLNEIAFQEEAPLSYFRIGDRIFNAPGVKDIVSYRINGGTSSIQAQVGEFFKLQEVTVHEAE